jgi:hypothetical protein
MTIGSGGRCAVAPMYATERPSPVTTGVHSSPVPGVSTSGAARSTGTRTTCRRSRSSGVEPAFAVKSSERRSGLKLMYSAMKRPGVSSSGSPPPSLME